MAHSKSRDSGLEIALDVLHRRKWAGLITFAVTLSIAVPFLLFLPDVYRSTATVIVESPEAPAMFVKAPMPELETRLVTIQQEILSRARLSDLITRFNLYPRLRPEAPMDALVERMRRDIHVEFTSTDQNRGRPTTIGLKISYISLDPKSAAGVPNALASLYVQENTKMRERQTGQMAQFLKSQLDTAQQELDRGQSRLNAFKALRAGELPDQVAINMVTLERLNIQLRVNRDDQEKLRERQERLATMPTGSGEPRDELAMLRMKLADLQSKFTDKHPDVIQTKARISELERQRTTSGSGGTTRILGASETLRGIDAELVGLEREEQALRSQIAAYDQRIRLAPTHEQELDTLERDYKTAKETYDSLHARYEEAQLAESLEQTKKGESFRILDAAVIPTLPAVPNRIRLLFLAMLLVTGSTVGVILLTDHLDTSFHTVGELRQLTSVPVLATIPYLKVPTNFMAQAARVALSAGAVICLCALLAFVAYHAARGNTQLVWMLAGRQL